MNECKIKVDEITIQGTTSKIKETLEKLGYPYYESLSKGLILIKDMDSAHLRNAIIKRAKELLDSLRLEEPETFAARLMNNGMFVNDKKIELLCNELKGRFNVGYPNIEDSCNEFSSVPTGYFSDEYDYNYGEYDEHY